MTCLHFEMVDEFGIKIFKRIEKLESGYALAGCCGGGCYIIQNMKFCPFCGEEL